MIQVKWDETVCIHSANCVKKLPNVFKVENGQFVIDESGASEDAIRAVVAECPSGAVKLDQTRRLAVMEDPTKIIAVVRGASNVEIQAIFRALTDKWLPDVRLAGLVAENHGLAGRHCQAGYLRNLTTGARYSIFHDLGPGMAMCHLDGVGAVAAAAAVQSDIAAGCDLVLLNKFGKLEIAGDGLVSAFRAAITAGLPLLTSVSPAHDEAWRRFVDREFAVLPADPAAIDLWRHAVQTQTQRSLRIERLAL